MRDLRTLLVGAIFMLWLWWMASSGRLGDLVTLLLTRESLSVGWWIITFLPLIIGCFVIFVIFVIIPIITSGGVAGLTKIWKAMFYFVAAEITKNPNLRGNEGENIVSSVLTELSKEYHCEEDFIVRTEKRETTQIDHVVFSSYGIFVIETKNYSGWIFGQEHHRTWRQTLKWGRKYTFSNPLRQNYSHIKALQAITKLPEDKFINMVVFIKKAKIKTSLPDNVCKSPMDGKRFITAHKQILLSDTQVRDAINDVKNAQETSPEVRREHVANLREKHSNKH